MRASLCKLLVGGLISLMMSSSAWAVAGFVVKKDGSRITGEEIRAKSNGDIVLRRGPGPIEFKAGTFKEAWAEKPSQWDAIGRAMDAGEYAKVIPALEKIIADYKFLGWDGRAAPLLGKAQLESGNAADALKTFEKVLSANPKAGESEAFKGQYYRALIANKEGKKVLPLLNEAIQSGSRELAAQSQMLRGDLNAANSRFEDALLDYLRTATLFRKVKSIQPEALLKTADTLETLKDSRAKKFYQKLVDEYPQSAQAREAQSKL